VKLRYTLRGAAELDQVLDYIEARSPQGARHVQIRIRFTNDLLLQYLAPVNLRAKTVSGA